MDNQVLILIMQAGIVLVAYLVGRYFLPTELGQETVEVISFISAWAQQFISYAAQYVNKPGPDKMDYVVSELTKIAEKEKIDISKEQIKAIAQNAYDAAQKGKEDASK